MRRTLATKLIGYALGRTVLPSDLPLVDKMLGDGGDAPFSQLVSEVISSKQFRTRLGRDDSPVHGTQLASNSTKAGTR